jgi:hypothetical protein
MIINFTSAGYSLKVHAFIFPVYSVASPGCLKYLGGGGGANVKVNYFINFGHPVKTF